MGSTYYSALIQNTKVKHILASQWIQTEELINITKGNKQEVLVEQVGVAHGKWNKWEWPMVSGTSELSYVI